MKRSTDTPVGLALDIWGRRQSKLDAFFEAQTVAVIGASEEEKSVGRSLLQNLLGSRFGGKVFPVNPHHQTVLGIPSYATIGAVPEKVDLAVIATPASTVPLVVAECAGAGVRGAVIISAGFREVGAEGARLEQEVLAAADPGRTRLIGPNCLGIMRPSIGLNASFAGAIARPGSVGFISQSGALCTAILDWSLRENVGFSAFISVGSMLDVNWGDLIDYLGEDPETQSIILYMESIGDARSFISAARRVALAKPIIVIKAGRTEAAAKAAVSHTGALVGSDQVFDAAFRRCGVLRVKTIADLFHMAEILAKQPRPKGPRLAIITNAGGPGVLATDALILAGGELADLSKEVNEALNAFLPAHWSHNNPIDVLGDADATRYRRAFEVVLNDGENDGVLVILAPQAVTDPAGTAEQLIKCIGAGGKPVLASWMGSAEVEDGERILRQADIPTFSYPDTAAEMFQAMWRFTYNLRGLYETPAIISETGGSERQVAAAIVEGARGSGRLTLTEPETKELLRTYGIPVVETRIARTAEEAVRTARAIGYPVAVKVFSETVTHKSDVGGVRLRLTDESAVRQAYEEIRSSVSRKCGVQAFQGVTVQPQVSTEGYELIVGCSLDPQFGPVLLFGAGGELVDVFKDHALALPPLNTTLARRLMEQTQVYKALQGVRGRKPVDSRALEELLVRFSRLVVENRAITEIEINPLLASTSGLTALDARAVVNPRSTPDNQLPQLAIRPYPAQYVSSSPDQNALDYMIRPIRPEDEPLMVNFHKALLESTVYMRYLHMLSLDYRASHERLIRICFNDYDRELALVAVLHDAKTGVESVAGVGRLTKVYGTNDAEMALVVADPFQGRGIGTELLRRVLAIGRSEKLARISADMLAENYPMQRLCEKLGLTLHRSDGDATIHAEIEF